jgi:hypothetical protein
MFGLDTWLMPENRGNRQKEITAIFLPYKCGKIEAELIAEKFLNHQTIENTILLQPQWRGLL